MLTLRCWLTTSEIGCLSRLNTVEEVAHVVLDRIEFADLRFETQITIVELVFRTIHLHFFQQLWWIGLDIAPRDEKSSLLALEPDTDFPLGADLQARHHSRTSRFA